jgi:hypothetical protein
MNEFEKLYTSYVDAGYSDDKIFSSLLLGGYSPQDIKRYMAYDKKKRQVPTKEYGQPAPQLYYTQTQEDGTESVSESGFSKPISDSSYSAVTKVEFEPISSTKDGEVEGYQGGSAITVGEPMFGSEAAAFGEIHKPITLPDGTDSSIHDFMRMDLYEDGNFMNALNLVVPENERSALETTFNAPTFTDEGGVVVPKKKAVETIRPYINKFVNDRIKNSVAGTFEQGQDPISTEKYILENFGYRTMLDEEDFVGSDMSAFEEGRKRMAQGFTPIANQMLVSGLNSLAFLAGDVDIDEYVQEFSKQINEDQKKDTEAFESNMPLRFMYDREAEDIGEDIEKYTLLGMTTEEMVQTAESAPVTLSSLAGALAAWTGTFAASKNPKAAANAAAFAQATIMGMAVHGQEYMSTFDDPNFYDYFKGDERVSIDEAVDINEFGELVVKDGYSRKHDAVRASGYSSVAAFSEFAGEFIGNKVIIGGGGLAMKKLGATGLVGRQLGKTSLSKGAQRAASYTAGLGSAMTFGAVVEGYEELVTEYMQSAARKEYSNQDASGAEYFRTLYASIIDPDEELKKNARIAKNSGIAMGFFLPLGVGTASIIQNERQIRAANDAERQNYFTRDQINKRNGTNFDALSAIDEKYFGSDAEFTRYEENRQKYKTNVLREILKNKGIIMAGMSKDERKLYNQEMKKLDKLFRTVNQDGQVDLEAIAALLPSIASRIDVLRDKIGISQNIANDLIKLAQQGNLEATEMLFSIMRNQVELRAMVQSRLSPNITEDQVKIIDEEIKNLEKRNSDLIVKAYKQAEGKGFQYTFVDDPQSASEATGLKVYRETLYTDLETKEVQRQNLYTVTYKNAKDLDPSVDISEQGVVQDGGFTLTEVGDAATVVTADNIDDFGLETKQADRLRELIAASPNARVIIHEGQESLDAAGARANMKGKNAFTLQDKQGRVFEIHLKQDFSLDVADEEFLHFEFNEELYKDEVRQPMIAAIDRAIQKNPNTPLAEFVRAHNARMAGNSQKMIEIELLTNLGRVIARQEEGIGGGVIKAKDVETVFDPDRSNFRPLMKRFDKYLKGRGPVRELAYDPSQVDNEGEVEGTAASYKPTFLDGKTVKGHLRNSEYGLSTTEVSAKIKDYNHYRNWYAKMTGNNKRPIRGLYYVDDNGQNVFIRTIPGHEKTDGAPLDWTGRNLFYKRDYKTKEIINMEPVPLTYGERQKSSFRREQEQRDARRQSQLARRQNLNAIAMNEYGKNIYNLASEVPGVQPLGYRDEFTQEEIELMEVYIAEKLGIVPVSAKRMTLPVPRVPRDMSGDIVEGTASSRELGRISYDFNNKAVKDILEKYGAETIDDLDIRQLSKDEIPYQLAVRLMGYTKFHVFEEGYAGMAPEVSIPRLSKQGRVEPGKKRETKSGAIHLMNMPEETIVTPSGARMPVINIAANSVKAIGTKVRQAALDAQADGAALVIPYMSLSDNNVFSDEAGFKVTMEWLIDNVEEWGDQELRLGSGKQTSSVVDQIAIGINSAIAGTESSGDLMYAFRLSAVKMAMADAKVSKYPFVENWSEERGVDEFGDPDITTNLSSVAIPTLQPEARSVSTQLYDPNVVKDALKLLIRMSDQYASDSYSNLKFGMRERVATSILSSISRLRTPESNSAAKRRPYIFTDQTKSVRDGAAATYVSEQLRHPDAYKGGAHVYAVVRPEAIVDVSQNNEETYRYVVKAKSNKAFMFRSRPEFNLDRESIEAAFPEVVDERGKKLQRPTGSTLIELNVEGTANSRRLGRISYVNGSTWQPSDPTSFGKAVDAVALKLQDKYADIMMLQKDIEEFRGRRMAPGNDFNLAVDLMYGKTRNDLDGLDARLDEIKEQMNLDDIKSDDLSDFTYAMHARERNAFIQSRRQDMEDGSGMTNEEAEEIIDRLGSNEMRRLHRMVMDIVKDTRKTMLDYGLETAETIQQYEDMYQYYIPLSGQAVDESSDERNMYPTGGIGMAVYGPTTRKAKGRSSKTGVNVIAQAVMQNARVKQLARKNEALQSLHSMFAGNPNEDVVTLWSPQNRMKTIDEKGKERKLTDSEMRARGDMVPIRINGEQHFIQFKNESHANTINGLSVDPTNILTRAMRKPAQWLRNVFTVYDPNFFVTNFSRDIQSALYNALAEAERTDGTVSGVSTAALTKEVLQNTALSLRGLLNENAFGREMDPVLKQFYEEWKESGGQTGWGYTKDIDQIIKDLDKDARSGLPSKVWKSAENVAAYIEGVNEAFENSIRLSAYISARKLGVTKDRAAQLSKNVTVNFNRSGEWGSTLNSVYLFFNAAMQGNARILRSLFFLKDMKKPNGEMESWHKRVTTPQKIAFGMTTFSAMATMLNLAMSDEDKDGELFYNKIPDYEKERNLIVMVNGKGYIKIPLPYGYNIFNNMGVASVEAMSGHRDPLDAMMFLATSATSAFSPISFGQSDNPGTYALKAIAPTVMKPLAEISANETYFGEKVYMEQLPFGTPRPKSEMSFRSPKEIQEFFTWMNEATGGSKYKSGSVDVNFDPYWYLFEYFIGGSGRFLGQGGKAIYDIGQATMSAVSEGAKGQNVFDALNRMQEAPKPDMSLTRMPLARKVYGEASRYYDFDLFEENAQEIMQLKKELREGLKVEGRGRYNGVNRLYKTLGETEKRLKRIRDRKRQARDISDYIRRSNVLTQLMEEEREAVMKFNSLYEQARGQN